MLPSEKGIRAAQTRRYPLTAEFEDLDVGVAFVACSEPDDPDALVYIKITPTQGAPLNMKGSPPKKFDGYTDVYPVDANLTWRLYYEVL